MVHMPSRPQQAYAYGIKLHPSIEMYRVQSERQSSLNIRNSRELKHLGLAPEENDVQGILPCRLYPPDYHKSRLMRCSSGANRHVLAPILATRGSRQK